MAQRIALFIDYQNVYKRAREAFDLGQQWHVAGQIRPMAAGLFLRGDANDRELQAVHVYRGMPSQRHDQRGYAAAQRQVAAWTSAGAHVHTRQLNYRNPSRPREKGIDVSLAIDVVMGIQRSDFDVALIFSDDTDMNPAFEAVGELRGPGHAELVLWSDYERGPRHVNSAGKKVFVHVLNSAVYERLADTQDYTKRSARKQRPPRK